MAIKPYCTSPPTYGTMTVLHGATGLWSMCSKNRSVIKRTSLQMVPWKLDNEWVGGWFCDWWVCCEEHQSAIHCWSLCFAIAMSSRGQTIARACRVWGRSKVEWMMAVCSSFEQVWWTMHSWSAGGNKQSRMEVVAVPTCPVRGNTWKSMLLSQSQFVTKSVR